MGKTVACQKGREKMFSSGKKIDEPLMSEADILRVADFTKSQAKHRELKTKS